MSEAHRRAISHGIRQFHRYTCVAFTATVIANVALLAAGTPIAWVTYSPLLPLAVLTLTGLYLFALPHGSRMQNRRHEER